MKEYFYEKDNKSYIIDDEKGLLVEDAKNNTEEILITQNNIEELESEIEFSNDNKQTLIDLAEAAQPKNIAITIVCIISIIGSFLIGFEKRPMLVVLAISMFSLQPIISIVDRFDFKKKLKTYDTYIKELETELEKENEKLNFLEKISKNKTVDYTAIKEIPKSEIVENLNYKKLLIKDYIKNRKKYISLFNNGILSTLLQANNYDVCDIEFIKYLIEEELKNENTKSNKKAKQKTK